MSKHEIKVDLRTGIGSNLVKKMRADNLIPGVIYSKGEESKVINVSNPTFLKVFKSAGTSSIIDVDLNGETIPVIVKSVQRHPVNGDVTHIDFQKLNMKEKIKMSIPINLVNRDSIILQPSILMQLMDQIDIECLPGDIPQTADVDVTNMNFEEPLYVKDLDVAKIQSISVLTDLEATVCTLSPPSIQEDIDEDADPEDVPVIGEDDIGEGNMER